jgi:6-phosphogluconolactonase
MSARRVLVLPDASVLANAAAGEFTRAASASKGPFRVALSGGTTPKIFYGLLADEKKPFRGRIPWERIQFFWSDERCVPPDHPDSNYRMAYEAMLSRVPVPKSNIHRVAGELPDSEQAASRYEEEIRREFSMMEGIPRFDWIFLGMGADGHTGSLFPGTTAVGESQKLVTSVWVEEKKTHRVTFTLPLLNASKNVAFVVSGPDKAETARKVLNEAPSAAHPSSLVQPSNGNLIWLLDQPAAGRLKGD